MSNIRPAFLLFAAILSGLSALAQREVPTTQQRKNIIQQQDREARSSAEAMARMARSNAILRAQAVHINAALSGILTERRSTRRSTSEVAHRAMALLVVAQKGAGLDELSVQRLVVRYQLQPFFTPKERAFILTAHPSQRDRDNFSWRFESAWVLEWSLGYVKTLDRPSMPIDADRALAFLRSRTAQAYVTDARLRPQREILDAADLIYRYDWAVVDARIGHTKAPAWLNPDVVTERHTALNWLYGYMGQAWDDVTTDT